VPGRVRGATGKQKGRQEHVKDCPNARTKAEASVGHKYVDQRKGILIKLSRRTKLRESPGRAAAHEDSRKHFARPCR
jgi:hypothetical protein